MSIDFRRIQLAPAGEIFALMTLSVQVIRSAVTMHVAANSAWHLLVSRLVSVLTDVPKVSTPRRPLSHLFIMCLY